MLVLLQVHRATTRSQTHPASGCSCRSGCVHRSPRQCVLTSLPSASRGTATSAGDPDHQRQDRPRHSASAAVAPEWGSAAGLPPPPRGVDSRRPGSGLYTMRRDVSVAEEPELREPGRPGRMIRAGGDQIRRRGTVLPPGLGCSACCCSMRATMAWGPCQGRSRGDASFKLTGGW